MEIISFIILFLFGSALGSFFGVIVDRLPREESIIKGRSHCDFCKKKLGPLDLVPLFSFLFLRGRCRYCKKKLSIFYPVIEFFTGFLFVLTYSLIGASIIPLVFSLFIISVLIIIFFTDLKHGIIPFPVIFPGIVITFFYILFLNYDLLGNALIAAGGAFLFFLVLFLITRGRGMGFGDVVYVILMGLLLGYPNIILGLYIAFVTGALISLALIIVRKKKLHGSTIAFGPFLVLGTVICFFWGDQMTDIILGLLMR